MLKTWSHHFQFSKEPRTSQNEALGRVYFFSGEADSLWQKIIKEQALAWQKVQLSQSEKELIYFVGQKGPVWILRPSRRGKESSTHGGLLSESLSTWIRDSVGSLVSHFRSQHLKNVSFTFSGSTESEEQACFFALEVAAYSYRQVVEGREHQDLPHLYFSKEKGEISKVALKKAQLEAQAMNTARHLVNMPPNHLNPTTYSQMVLKMKWPTTVKIEVWDEKRLKRENMGLLLAVGQGAEAPPCMVHIKYRPKKKKNQKPVAFVGKGVTFDTGGLDIKPSSGMRLMKKDMGGSAAVLGLAQWVAHSDYSGPCDFYLCLAENSVDQKSFRPSDVVTARNGMKVEIDNTDAEGRLVLADGLDVAVTSKEAPEVVINVATLTGAIKVALGAEVAGLFCNNDELAMELQKAGQRSGDVNWRMPLVEKYFSSMSSSFADFKNSSEGFGGAITAALFLQKFVRGTPWAHLDIYAWNDKAHGPLNFTGGNGQAVQCLIEWLKARS